MRDIEFWKMSGSGNDFVLVDNRDGQISDGEMGRFVQSVCRRRVSVGADGVIFVTRSRTLDFAWRFFNADGGEVEMCGNGSRCVARFAHLKGIAGPDMTFETLAGPVQAHVKGRLVKVLMPKPSGLTKDIELKLPIGDKRCRKDQDSVQPDMKGTPYVESGRVIVRRADFINTGVPHVVIQVRDLDRYPVFEEGRAVRYNSYFAPAGTNANFMTMIGPQEIEIRTYERGVEEETLACGTGAIACALTSAAHGKAVSPVRVKTKGGETLVIYFETNEEGFDKVFLEGNTAVVYRAFLNEEALD
jgi:diaminopimelate epimerase